MMTGDVCISGVIATSRVTSLTSLLTQNARRT
jgi:hypothetical protein